MKSKLAIPAKKPKHPIRLFMDAVAYRVPLPVTKVIAHTNTTYPICPRCDLSIDREYMSFCDCCGQRLHWGLFEHAKVIYPGPQREQCFSKKLSLFPFDSTYVIEDIFGGFTLEREALGKRIRESRIKKGYTQQELADQAEIGVVYLSEIERGIKMPSLNIFIKIINALDVSADYVLRDELSSGKEYICTEITGKLLTLSPEQRKTATDILNAYLNNLP